MDLMADDLGVKRPGRAHGSGEQAVGDVIVDKALAAMVPAQRALQVDGDIYKMAKGGGEVRGFDRSCGFAAISYRIEKILIMVPRPWISEGTRMFSKQGFRMGIDPATVRTDPPLIAHHKHIHAPMRLARRRKDQFCIIGVGEFSAPLIIRVIDTLAGSFALCLDGNRCLVIPPQSPLRTIDMMRSPGGDPPA